MAPSQSFRQTFPRENADDLRKRFEFQGFRLYNAMHWQIFPNFLPTSYQHSGKISNFDFFVGLVCVYVIYFKSEKIHYMILINKNLQMSTYLLAQIY